MSDTLASLSRKINGAAELKSVVRSMKALAASSIGQYEKAVLSLKDYERTVELSLSVCLRHLDSTALGHEQPSGRLSGARTASAIVFGSDQGLVGQFNDELGDFVTQTLVSLPGAKVVWAVGERIESRLADAGLVPVERFGVPTSVHAITSLISQILLAYESHQHEGAKQDHREELYLFYNSVQSGGSGEVYKAVKLRLLPPATAWAQSLVSLRWPSSNLPEVIGDSDAALKAFVREHLFVSLFKACAESLAAENASRLAAMQRAEKNINDLVEGLTQTFRRLRQTAIDEELFDVLSGNESQQTRDHPT